MFGNVEPFLRISSRACMRAPRKRPRKTVNLNLLQYKTVGFNITGQLLYLTNLPGNRTSLVSTQRRSSAISSLLYYLEKLPSEQNTGYKKSAKKRGRSNLKISGKGKRIKVPMTPLEKTLTRNMNHLSFNNRVWTHSRN